MKNILYEDNDILVAYKPAGIATQTSRIGQQDMVSELKNYLVKAQKEEMAGKNGKDAVKKQTFQEPYLGLVHRLDQPVSGVLVFAKNKKAAADLSNQISNGTMKKFYYALIYGTPIRERDTLEDYLYKDGRENLSIIVNATFPDAKKAILNYRHCSTLMVLEEGEEVSLMEIELLTGRHHQIRAQMSNAGMPLLGDSKYGSERSKELSRDIGCKNVALCAYKLSFKHPATHKEMVFEREPDEELFDPFLNEGIL